jgi:hypothetical protein
VGTAVLTRQFYISNNIGGVLRRVSGDFGRWLKWSPLVLSLWVAGCGGSGNNIVPGGSGTPPAPAGLNAIAGDTQVTLAWNTVSGAASYKVYRDGVQVATPAKVSYSDSPLNNDTTYTYQVSAVNAAGEGAKSAAITAKPHAQVPTAPTGLNAVAGDGQVALSWDSLSGATGYVIYRNGAKVGTPTQHTYLDNGLTNGTTYTYQVTATNARGEGAKSSSVNATPQAQDSGKPGPDNTGVPAGTTLTVVEGDQVYSVDNEVISGLDIHGYVQITGQNVTIKNSIIRAASTPKPCAVGNAENSAALWVRDDTGASATIQDSEIVPSNPTACMDGVWAIRTTLLRVNIHGSVDGVKAYDNVRVQDSWIHDMVFFDVDPNQTDGTHNDAVQTYEGDQHIWLVHNNLQMKSTDNSAYQLTQDNGRVATDIHIESNWLDGGGCTLNLTQKGGPAPMTGIYILNNRFGRNSYYQCPILIGTQTVLNQNSGNVWDDNGQPIPSPQQHD